MPGKKQQTTYDTIFDFVFATQKQVKKKGGKDQPGITMPDVSGLGAAFAEIALHPGLYAAENIASSMGGLLNGEAFLDWRVYGKKDFKQYASEDKELVGDIGSVDDVRFRIRANEAASFINDPRAYVNKAVKKYKAGKKWTRFGNFTRTMSAAQYSIWAHQALKNAGIANASELAGMVAHTMNGGESLLGGAMGEYKELRTTFNLMSEDIQGKHGISSSLISQAVDKALVVDSELPDAKDRRFQATVNELTSNGVNISDAESAAERFWGKRGVANDVGVYTGKIHDVAQKELIRKLESERVRLARTDPRKASEIQGLINGLNGLDSSWGKVSGGGPLVLGQFIGKAGFTYKWLQDYMFSGAALGMAVSGDMFSTGAGDNIFRILSSKTITDRAGNVIKNINGDAETIAVGSGLPQRILAPLQYIHPANVVKGLLWDGRHYKWLAYTLGKGSIDLTNPKSLSSIFYKIYRRMPGVFMSKATKWLRDKIYKATLEKVKYAIAKVVKQIFKKAITETASQLAKLSIKAFLTKILTTIITQVLGSAVPGIGNIAALIVDVVLWIGSMILEKLIGPILQFIALIIVGFIAMICINIGFIMWGISDVNTMIHRHIAPPFTGAGSVDDLGPIEWGDIPDGYEGACPAPGPSQRCTQGSTQNTSSYHLRTRAVDFGLVGGTPIVAPHDGHVTRAQSVSRCSDGTNYGGTVIFKEVTNADGSGGNTWSFIHMQSAVPQGAFVEKGMVLGYVDGHSTAEYSPSCWTGPHIHIHVQNPSGGYIDSEIFLKQIGCNFNCP